MAAQFSCTSFPVVSETDTSVGYSDLAVLANPQQYAPWKQVLTEAYAQLHRAIEQDSHDVIDDYGATSPAEFFAVVTETFFEKPKQLKHQHPALYEQFRAYYQLDPIQWGEARDL